jgi:ribonuclease HI
MNILKIYTDGSYNPITKECRYGYIVIDKDNNIIYQYVNKRKENTGLGNTYAELKAVMMAIKFISKKKGEAQIYSDYKVENIIYTNKDKYKTKHDSFLHGFKTFMRHTNKYYKLNYVKGHSDDIFNKYIDKLLKRQTENFGIIIKVS